MSSYDPQGYPSGPGGYERPPGWYEPPPPPGHGGGHWDEEAGRDGPPWEQREELGLLPALFRTLWEVLLHPGDVFATARRTGGLTNPLLYGISAGVFLMFVAGAILLALTMATGGGLEARIIDSNPNMPAEQAEELRRMIQWLEANLGVVAIGLFIGIFTFFPIMVAMQLFMSSAVTHVCLMIVGGANRDFETTFRTVAYIYPTTVMLQAVPYCGGMIAAVWTLFAKITALKEMHETDTWRVVLAVLLPMLVCCACIVAGIAVLLPAFLQGWQQATGVTVSP